MLTDILRFRRIFKRRNRDVTLVDRDAEQTIAERTDPHKSDAQRWDPPYHQSK